MYLNKEQLERNKANLANLLATVRRAPKAKIVLLARDTFFGEGADASRIGAYVHVSSYHGPELAVCKVGDTETQTTTDTPAILAQLHPSEADNTSGLEDYLRGFGQAAPDMPLLPIVWTGSRRALADPGVPIGTWGSTEVVSHKGEPLLILAHIDM